MCGQRTLAVIALVVSAGFSNHARAATKVTSPGLDFKGDVVNQVVPNGNGFPTSTYWITIWGSPRTPPTFGAPATIYPYNNPNPNTYPQLGYGYVINEFRDFIGLNNGPALNNNPARFAAAAEYVSYDDGALPAATMTVTTVYGADANPSSPGVLAITGFDTAGVYPSLSNETITGPSGTTYPSSAGQLVQVQNLATVLGAGYDLSYVSGPATNSVYVFRTTVPFSEAAVPEPATLSVFGLAGLTLAARRRRSVA